MSEESPRIHSTRTRVRRALADSYHALRRLTRDIHLDLALRRWAVRDRELLEEARRLCEETYRQESNPLVSVTIPTYNRGELLVNRTLPSVLSQTYQNLEIVIVGDCCTDNTARLVAELGAPRIQFLNLPERGRYPDNRRNRWMVAGTVPINTAIDLARGAWLAYLDDDDEWTPDHIEVLLHYAQTHGVELVYSYMWGEGRSGEWRANLPSPTFTSGRPPFGVGPLNHSSVMYRSYLRFLKYDIDAWRYGKPVDNLMWQRMGRVGVRWGLVKRCLGRIYYRDRGF